MDQLEVGTERRQSVITSSLPSDSTYGFLHGWIDADEYLVADERSRPARPSAVMPEGRPTATSRFALGAAVAYGLCAFGLYVTGEVSPSFVSIGLAVLAASAGLYGRRR